MKAILYINICLVLLHGVVSGQCTNGGLKVQSDACEAPTNLAVSSVDCAEMKITWAGGKSQLYMVKTTLTDSINKSAEVKTWEATTNKAGNGEATIRVQEGFYVSWAVQAVCKGENYSLYSAEIRGEERTIPFCKKEVESSSPTLLSVYPNPAKKYLMVEYTGKGEGAIEFQIVDMWGKNIFNKVELPIANIKSTYKLDINQLLPGTYVLKSINEKDGSSQVKFVKVNL